MTANKTFGFSKSVTSVVDKYAGVETRKQIEKEVGTLAASMYIVIDLSAMARTDPSHILGGTQLLKKFGK